MAHIKCSLCGGDLHIDEPGSEAYITEKDGTIHHVVCPPVEPTPA